MKKQNTTKKLPKKDSTFASRLNYLMVKSGYDPKKDQTRLSNELKQKVTQPQLSNILKGESKNPKYETLVTLSDFFKVSIDFLVGRSDYESKNHELADISKKIGLSVQSLEKLQLFKIESEREKDQVPQETYSQEYIEMIDLLIKNHLSETIVYHMKKYFKCILMDSNRRYDLEIKDTDYLDTFIQLEENGELDKYKDSDGYVNLTCGKTIDTLSVNKTIIEKEYLNDLRFDLQRLRECSTQAELRYSMKDIFPYDNKHLASATRELEQRLQATHEEDIRDRLDAVKK